MVHLFFIHTLFSVIAGDNIICVLQLGTAYSGMDALDSHGKPLQTHASYLLVTTPAHLSTFERSCNDILNQRRLPVGEILSDLNQLNNEMPNNSACPWPCHRSFLCGGPFVRWRYSQLVVESIVFNFPCLLSFEFSRNSKDGLLVGFYISFGRGFGNLYSELIFSSFRFPSNSPVNSTLILSYNQQCAPSRSLSGSFTANSVYVSQSFQLHLV